MVVRVLHVVKQSRLTGLDEGGEWERSLALNKPHLRADLTAAVNGHQPLVSGTTDLHKEPEERPKREHINSGQKHSSPTIRHILWILFFINKGILDTQNHWDEDGNHVGTEESPVCCRRGRHLWPILHREKTFEEEKNVSLSRKFQL